MSSLRMVSNVTETQSNTLSFHRNSLKTKLEGSGAPESWIIEITMYHLPLAGMEYLLITMNDGQSVKKTSIKIRHATLSVGYIIINSCSRHNVFLHTTDS